MSVSSDISFALAPTERALKQEIETNGVTETSIQLAVAVAALRAASKARRCSVCGDHGCEFCPDPVGVVIPFPGTEGLHGRSSV